MKRNAFILLLLVLTAFMVRVLVIWIGRPDFVGWFNHTYYYYVQTEGLLNNGDLPFPDMPLLFYVYAFTAKIFTFLGQSTPDAIVNATRFWMSLIPALIPIPLYATFVLIFKKEVLPKWIWIFLIVGAFYPLSILHIPEFLQKNLAGLLLLAIFFQQLRSALNSINTKKIISLILIFAIIVCTHYGSAAVALLYTLALFISLVVHKKKKSSLKLGLGILAGLSLTLSVFYILDPQRYDRIIFYFDRIADTSSLGLIFTAGDADIFNAILIVVVPLIIALVFLRFYKKAKPTLSYENSVFWLCNIICCYLLVLPIYDQLLVGRFANFLILPLIFVLTYTLHYTLKKAWLKKLILGLVLFGTLVIAFGDITSLFRHNRNKEQIYQDLMDMKEETQFSSSDLIITRNGAEHICNWFLDTKSCLITSFTLNDFKQYDRIFILNPTEGSMAIRGDSNEAIVRYNYMLSNIQEPATAADLIYELPSLRLLQLKEIPQEWVFDEKGRWISYQ